MTSSRKRLKTIHKKGDVLLFKGCKWVYHEEVQRWYPTTRPLWLPIIDIHERGWEVLGCTGPSPLDALKNWAEHEIRERRLQRDKYRRKFLTLQSDVNNLKAKLWNKP